MPFFAPRLDRPDFDTDDFEEPWYQEGDRTIGGIVPVQLVLAEGAQVAIVVSQLAADPGGLTIRLTVVRRKATDNREQLGGHHVGIPQSDGLRFGVGFADGTIVELQLSWLHDATDAAWTLEPRGGSGSNARYDQDLRLSPAPPPGPLTIACAWPELDVDEVEAVVDGDLIATALSEARTLWPEDPEEAPEHERWLNYAPGGRVGSVLSFTPDEDGQG